MSTFHGASSLSGSSRFAIIDNKTTIGEVCQRAVHRSYGNARRRGNFADGFTYIFLVLKQVKDGLGLCFLHILFINYLLFKIFEQAKILNKHAAKIHKINKLRK